MSIIIREYLGSEGLQVDWNTSPTPYNVLNTSEGATSASTSANSIFVDIEGIHVGPTRNFTWYTKEALYDSIPSWTRPYLRPLIMHHNEKDGKIIGRIRAVELLQVSAKSKTPALLFTANVPDPEGKEQIKDGRLNTVSIGAIVHEARCSICGANIAEMSKDELENHEHQRGQKYDGKICYWMIMKMEAKELSYVIVPSDVYAQNVRVYQPSDKEIKESNKGVFNLTIAESAIAGNESTIIDENGQPAAPAVEAPVVNPEVEALKQDVEKLTLRVKELEGQVDAKDAELVAFKAKADEAVKSLDDTKVLLDQAQKEVKSAQDNLAVKENELTGERTLREAAETNAITLTTKYRANVVESIVTMRSALGKPELAKEDLEARTDDSLKDAVFDLKEELTKRGVDPSAITPALNPGAVKIEESSSGNVNKDKNLSNIDLREGLVSIFDSVIGSKSKIN